LQFLWEGPYIVTSSVRDGAFHLKDEEGVELPHSWNVDNLRTFFPQCQLVGVGRMDL
jgi:hypothetical protein